MPKPTPAAEIDVDDVAELPVVERSADALNRLEAMHAEERLLKEWKRNDKVGERPATPVIDAMTAAYEAAGGAPGSSLAFLLGDVKRSTRTGAAREPKRAPAMPEIEVERRMRDLFTETPTLTQSAATLVMLPEGARARSIRRAYKLVRASMPKPLKTAAQPKPRAKKSSAPVVETVVDDGNGGYVALDASAAIVDALNGDTRPLTSIVENVTKKPSTKKPAAAKPAAKKSAAVATSTTARAASDARKSSEQRTAAKKLAAPAKPAAKSTSKNPTPLLSKLMNDTLGKSTKKSSAAKTVTTNFKSAAK